VTVSGKWTAATAAAWWGDPPAPATPAATQPNPHTPAADLDHTRAFAPHELAAVGP
jgi:hypothetical protein